MRLIDADALLKHYNGNILTAQTDYAEGCRGIIDDIKSAPTIDSMPVVRCKDCEYGMLWIKPQDKVIGDCALKMWNSNDEQFWTICEDDFCSNGKLKGDNK